MPNTPLNRRTLLSRSAVGLAALLGACAVRNPGISAAQKNERVVIVGAGPAGMTAAHLLRQNGVDVVVLEAASNHGGRIKHHKEFTDFPISLGAEWMHVPPDILKEIVNDPTVEIKTQTTPYDPADKVGYYDGELSLHLIGKDHDRKFVGSSWLDFFDTYIYPNIADTITFNTPITEIDYTGNGVRLTDTRDTTHTADRVIITAPLKILQRGDIQFTPALPAEHLRAINKAEVWSGLKVFVEFTEKFYPAALSFPDTDTRQGQLLYYDAAYGQNTQANILGLFAVGRQAETYQALSEDGLRRRILTELDEVFDGAASKRYVRHLVQNWNDEPFARAAYLADHAPSWISRRLSRSVDHKLFFAGDAYTRFDDWGSVHCAVRSAADAVEDLLG